MSEPKEICSCGNPQSYPIPHEHDQTEREKAIIKHFRNCHEELVRACEDALRKLEWPIYTNGEKLSMKACRVRLTAALAAAKE